jgi:hypothetical protein
VSEVSPGHLKFKFQRLLKKFFFIGKERSSLYSTYTFLTTLIMVHLSYFFKVSHPFWVAVYQSIINLCGGRNCIFFKCTLETSLSTRYRQHLQYILGDSTVAWGSCHITHNCVYFCLKLDCNVGVQSCKRALES